MKCLLQQLSTAFSAPKFSPDKAAAEPALLLNNKQHPHNVPSFLGNSSIYRAKNPCKRDGISTSGFKTRRHFGVKMQFSVGLDFTAPCFVEASFRQNCDRRTTRF